MESFQGLTEDAPMMGITNNWLDHDVLIEFGETANLKIKYFSDEFKFKN